MSKLTYFMWIDDYDTDISPDEEMMEYLKQNCPMPTDEELELIEKQMRYL